MLMQDYVVGIIYIIFFTVIFIGVKNTFLLYRSGKRIPATITKLELKKRHRGWSYDLTHAFSVKGKMYQSPSIPVSQKIYDAFKKGDQIDVLYLERNPACNVIADDIPRTAKLYMILITFLALTLAWYIGGELFHYEWKF